jgi:hypothetical protein
MASQRVVRPVWRRFDARFWDQAGSWVRRGGHAAVVTDPNTLDMLLGAEEGGKITELGLWSVLAIEQQRYRRVKVGPAAGLWVARVAKHAIDSVLDWCERDAILERPTRALALDCLDCAACCRDATVLLGEDDLDRFREAGRVDLCGSKYVKRERSGKRTLRLLYDGRCQHLGAGNLCSIYEIRPFNCSVFPVGSEACLAARETTLGLRDGAPAPRALS